MKIVWTLLLGMLIFQSLFVAFGFLDAFNIGNVELEGMENVSSSIEGYEDIDVSAGQGIWGLFTGVGGSIIITAATAGLIILALAAKNYPVAAIMGYLGFVSWLYIQTAGILIKMNDIGGGSAIGLAFIGLFGVVLAILVVKSIIEMLAPGGVE